MILDDLKRAAPSRLEVILADDTTQKVAIARAGKKWDKAVKVLESLDWVEVRMFDIKDNLVGSLRADVEGADDETDDEFDDSPGEMPESAIAKIILSTVKATMAESRRMFEVQMRAQSDAMGQLTEANRMVIESYKHAMELQRAWLTAPEADEGKGNMGEVMQMMQVASMFLAQKRNAPPIAAGSGG